MSEPTQTPRTYAAMYSTKVPVPTVDGDVYEFVSAAFARQLEKELGEAIKENERLAMDYGWDTAALKREADSLRAHNQALRGALESIARAPAFDANTQSIVDLARRALLPPATQP